jgi:hypothetical protein
VDGLVERGGVCEGLVGEVMRLEVVPDDFDVVEFGCVFGQPLDAEPMRTGGEAGERELADVDRPIVLDQHDRLGGPAGLGAVEIIELLKMGHEIAAALGGTGMDDELAGDVIERASPASQPSWLVQAPERAGPRRTSPRRVRDKGVSAPRFHRDCQEFRVLAGRLDIFMLRLL